MSLNLNHDEFEGGQVCFPEYGRMLYNPVRGGALFFSCSLVHEALPVTKGKRFALFTFLTDQAGLQQEKKMKASSFGRNLEVFAMRPTGIDP